MNIDPSTPNRTAADAEQAPPGPRLRVGSRTSRLAMAYTGRVVDALTAVLPSLDVEVVGIRTSGDAWKGDLAELGGKGAFMKEIDDAMVAGRIDVAVHAMKDVPGDVPPPDGLMFGAYLRRDDVRDCVVWRAGSKYSSLEKLPAGTIIGTSAVRRRAQILRSRPELRVVPFRGNVIPRLARLDENTDGIEALILARGGLAGAGAGHRVGQVLPIDTMCPAVGAGVIGVQCRENDEAIRALLARIDHRETRAHITAERAMLHGLQGHCNSPIAGHCTTTPDGRLSLTGIVFSHDGATFAHACGQDTPGRAAELGAYVAAALARRGAHDIIADIPH